MEYQRMMTVEEYFQLEENDPETRYEYVDGHVYAMAGATANHDTIKSNIQPLFLSPNPQKTLALAFSSIRTNCGGAMSY
jgi:Uma2 family endonuclease